MANINEIEQFKVESIPLGNTYKNTINEDNTITIASDRPKQLYQPRYYKPGIK